MARDAVGVSTSPPVFFDATPAAAPAFVRVSTNDWRRFEAGGRELHLVGHNTRSPFDTRMDEEGLAAAAAFQDFLVEELGFAPQANLVGMSWGGFFSTRYAAKYPENVRKIYLDAPLLNFDGFGNPDYGRIGVWANRRPADDVWTDDPEMPVNKAAQIAAAKIPSLLVYGGSDTVVPPVHNCRIFAARFKAAGGDLQEIPRNLFGHHPHGLDPDKTQPIVDFFAGQD